MKRDHSTLIYNVSEISGLLDSAESLELFLQKIVGLIAEHMQSEVCSIYLFDEGTRQLELKATKGLNIEAAGEIKLKLGEGLTGLALKELRPICVENASQSPGFHYFPHIGEEEYESFLAVPMIRGQKRIGVIVVQSAKKNYFSKEDVRIFRAITSQLAQTIETTKLFMGLRKEKQDKIPEKYDSDITFVKGKVGSKGFGFAEAKIFVERDIKGYVASVDGRTYTSDDLHRAIQNTERYLEDLQKKMEGKLSDVASLIFTAQILMLKDQAFLNDILVQYRNNVHLPTAVANTICKYSEMFDQLSDEYLREKKKDVEDVGFVLLQHLIGSVDEKGDYADSIVVAKELYTSDLLKLSIQNIQGVVLLSGGITSHLSILARSLSIPLIISEYKQLLDIPPQTRILLEGENGNIYINPKETVIQSFKESQAVLTESQMIKEAKETTLTKNSVRVTLLANINLLNDVKAACSYKAEGVGLYRTEFPFMIRSDFPTEEEQFVIYKKLVGGLPNKEITFRTLDIGGDKVLSYYDNVKERNPFLGMRSIRFSLRHKDIFSQQIRAILRAGVDADIKIMFPMISSLEEFREAKNEVSNCLQTLEKEKYEYNPHPQIGVMIELPAVLEIMEDLAKEADFFSVGTNDFVQYMLAVDRTNEKVSELYLQHHPSVMKALNKIAGVAKKYKKDVSICGDMAHEERYVFFLLGIGIRRLSLDPTYIPKIQKVIERIDLKQALRATKMILKQKTSKEIDGIITGFNAGL